MNDLLFYRDLIIKFLSNEISDNELDLLKSWLEEDSKNRLEFDRQNKLWQNSDIKTINEIYQTDKAWLDISRQLEIGEKNNKNTLIIKKTTLRLVIAAASLAFLVVFFGMSLWMHGKRSYMQQAASTIISTKEGEKARIFLSDSTQVTLNSASTLEYKANYNFHDRKINLTGEAFFNVKTNPDKPFIIHLGAMSVSATGTSFNIFSYGEENRIETTLVEGSLKILIGGRELINLNPGEQLIYLLRTNKAVVKKVNTETYTSWQDNKLRLLDTPFEEALRNIARKYNVIFEIRDTRLLELKYTATFIDESIDDVMQMLKTVSPITYNIYKRAGIEDKEYVKPRITIDKRKTRYRSIH